MSNEERVSWVSLLVNLLIGYLYFSAVLALPADADQHFRLSGFVVNLIVLAIVLGIAGEIALRWVQRRAGDDEAPADERDRAIGLKATRNGHIVLVCSVIVVLVQISLMETLHRRGGSRPLPAAESVAGLLVAGPLTVQLVAQLLLAALTLASVATYASRIVYYRRGI